MSIIDFHSHILPGIDDGSDSVEESIAMLQEEAAQGIECVVATPHFYAAHHDLQRFLKKRYEAEMRLREEMERHPGLPRLEIGAEVSLFSGISDSDQLLGLTIGKERFILIEVNHSPWPEKVYQELLGIYEKRGLTPIVAHVDRYIAPFQTHGIPARLEELPVLVQANASFFQRWNTKNLALRMLQRDQIHLLGSDCHNMTTRRPNLGETVSYIRQHQGEDALDRIREHQQWIFAGN